MITADLDAARTIAEHVRRQLDIASQREFRPEDIPDAPDADRDRQVRDLAAGCPQFAAAYSLHNAGHPVVALDTRGEPADEPTRDLDLLLARWRTSPGRWPGRPCGPGHDLAALALDPSGWAWLADRAKVEDDTRPTGWADGKHYTTRDHLGDRVLITAPPAPAPRMRTLSLPLHLTDEDWQRIAKPPLPPQQHWLCWRWPDGWTLPLGRARHGWRLLPALPAETAVLDLDGQTWHVATGGRPYAPMPDWLALALGGKP